MGKAQGAGARAEKPVNGAGAAARLSIDLLDPPDVGRQCTRAGVLGLRRERPHWLAAARRGHAADRRWRAERRGEVLAAMVEARGDTRGDDRSDTMIPYADEACMDLVMVTNVSDADARRAVQARWPSMACDELAGEMV